MNQQELKNFVESNPKLVTMRATSVPGLFVLKYKKTVFFNNLWNDFLEECRGTIVDKDFNVVSRPFTKIYNFRVEAKSPVLDDSTPITAYRKVNGFMVAATWCEQINDVLVSTTGSTDSDYVSMAKEIMLKHMCWADWQMALLSCRGMTLMFECCHPNDPHIVPEDTGMYFLGWRENTWDSKVKGFGLASAWREFATDVLKCKVAESQSTTVGELVKQSKTVKHEGFVFYTVDGVSAKIKSPHYLINKFVARNPRTDKLMDAHVKSKVEEEFYPLIDAIQANIEAYTAMDEQARLAWVREFLEKQ